MAIKLGGIQVALIGAAAQRGDRLFSLPEGQSKAAARRAASALVTSGLAREVRAYGAAPVWRHDAESQRDFALKLTAAGVKSVAMTADGSKAESQPTSQGEESEPVVRAAVRDDETRDRDAAPGTLVAPRAGTKIDKVVKMLGRPEGATLEALAQATGWLPHTTSAALTGLRKRGYALERSRDTDVGPSVYRLTPPIRAVA